MSWDSFSTWGKKKKRAQSSLQSSSQKSGNISHNMTAVILVWVVTHAHTSRAEVWNAICTVLICNMHSHKLIHTPQNCFLALAVSFSSVIWRYLAIYKSQCSLILSQFNFDFYFSCVRCPHFPRGFCRRIITTCWLLSDRQTNVKHVKNNSLWDQ